MQAQHAAPVHLTHPVFALLCCNPAALKPCRQEVLAILVDATARPAWARLRDLQHPLLAMLADADGGVRAAALTYWHTSLPRALPARLRGLLEVASDPTLPEAWQQRLHARWPCIAAALLLRTVEGSFGASGGPQYFTQGG
jgi:hypothetical protein